MRKEEVLKKITDCGIVAVVRADNTDQAMKICDACIKGGVAGIELTYTVPGITDVIKELSNVYSRNSEIVIGAGTVMDPETARAAILAGAQYIVSPYLNVDMVKLCNRYQVAVMPGAMTIKEVVEAMDAGADVIKVFPASLFGPSIIKAIKGPIPQAPLMPTGGVSVNNVADWIKAGAVAVGAGSELTGGAKKGDYESITTVAKEFVKRIREARQ